MQLYVVKSRFLQIHISSSSIISFSSFVNKPVMVLNAFIGISLQLSEEPAHAEQVYKQALSLATPQQAHTIFSNLGNLYRQEKKYPSAKAMFTKSLELQPGYAPAYNNLGLVFVAEGRWKEAEFCFNKALQSDPLLDAAKSNMIKAAVMSRVCQHLSSCSLQD